MRKTPLQNGFTLLELLLYVSISGIIVLFMFVSLQIIIESRIKNQTIAEVEQQGILVMQLITQAVRNADIINSPSVGTTGPTLSINTYLSGNNPTVFDLSGDTIRTQEGTSGVVLLTNSRVTVSDLTFQNLSRVDTPGTIRVSFVITHNNPSGRNEYSFTKTFYSSATLRQP